MSTYVLKKNIIILQKNIRNKKIIQDKHKIWYFTQNARLLEQLQLNTFLMDSLGLLKNY